MLRKPAAVGLIICLLGSLAAPPVQGNDGRLRVDEVEALADDFAKFVETGSTRALDVDDPAWPIIEAQIAIARRADGGRTRELRWRANSIPVEMAAVFGTPFAGAGAGAALVSLIFPDPSGALYLLATLGGLTGGIVTGFTIAMSDSVYFKRLPLPSTPSFRRMEMAEQLQPTDFVEAHQISDLFFSFLRHRHRITVPKGLAPGAWLVLVAMGFDHESRRPHMHSSIGDKLHRRASIALRNLQAEGGSPELVSQLQQLIEVFYRLKNDKISLQKAFPAIAECAEYLLNESAS